MMVWVDSTCCWVLGTVQMIVQDIIGNEDAECMLIPRAKGERIVQDTMGNEDSECMWIPRACVCLEGQ